MRGKGPVLWWGVAALTVFFFPMVSNAQSSTLDELLQGLREEQGAGEPAAEEEEEPEIGVMPGFLREAETEPDRPTPDRTAPAPRADAPPRTEAPARTGR